MTEVQEINAQSPFRVGDWLVYPQLGRVSRGNEEHKIEPKAMTVLVCLAQQQGQVISREVLEEKAWAGMVVGYDSLASAIIKLRKGFGDSSKNPRYIETVPKKGYRLICNVTPLNDADTSDLDNVSSSGAKPLLIAIVLASALGLLALTVLVFYFVGEETSKTPQVIHAIPDKPVIAVLPFKNLSDDAQQDYFSDGVTADLITDLSKISGLSVIARNSVFSYRDYDVDIRKVQKELGVNYVVEGSIRKVGKQVRVTARLIDAGTSINLWADRFDGTLDNIFAFQDAVTEKIISSLEVKLTDKERTRLARKYSNSIEAYDLFLHGWKNLWLSSRESTLVAREYFMKAIELDKNFARAYANVALSYIYGHMLGWSNDSERDLQLAHQYADQAIALDPELPQVYWVKGFAEIFSHDYQQALEYGQKSIDLDPNFAAGYGMIATALNYAGKAEQAEHEMKKAMLLDPKHPAIYKVIYGEILFNKREYEAAIEAFKYALNSNPESEESRLWLAAAYAHTGELDEANWQLEQLRVNGSLISLKRFEKTIPLNDPEQRKHLIDGLYKAGLTE